MLTALPRHARSAVGWGVVGVLALTAAGCADAAGSARPGAAEESRSRPKIERPLDATPYAPLEKFCSIIPANVRQELNLRVHGNGAVFAENPQCHFQFDRVDFPVSVKLYANRDLLSEAYLKPRPDEGLPPNFVRPLTISGQPAAQMRTSTSSDDNDCKVILALSDTAGVDIDVSLTPRACPVATRLAEGIVQTLTS